MSRFISKFGTPGLIFANDGPIRVRAAIPVIGADELKSCGRLFLEVVRFRFVLARVESNLYGTELWVGKFVPNEDW